MKRMPGTGTISIALGFLIAGIAIGFAIPRPAAVAPPSFAKHDDRGRATHRPAGRNFYAPTFRNDEYVRGEQLRVVEMLEQQCRSTKIHCELSRAARQAFNRN